MLTSISNLIQSTQGIALLISSLLMTVAFIVFLLAIIFYINKRRSGDADGFRQAGNMLLGSVFALFVMVAVWGMVFFISNALGIGIGGCTSRPSSLPGVANNVDCGTGSASGVRSTTVTSPARTNSELFGGNPLYDPTTSQTDPVSTSPARSTNSSCSAGVEHRAAYNELLYCTNGQKGEACKSGTCATGQCIDSFGNNTITNVDQNNAYGTCQ